MKKQVAAVAMASALLFGAAVQAQAYFEDGHLTQVVYNANNNEVFTDLGMIGTDFNMSDTGKVLSSAGTVDYSMVGVGSWSDVSMAMFADNTDISSANPTGYHFYFATAKDTFPQVSQTNGRWAAFDAAEGRTTDQIIRNGGDVNSTVALDQPTNDQSYTKNFNGAGPGTYSLLNESAATNGEANLAELMNANGYVDMYLWHYGTKDLQGAINGTAPLVEYIESATLRLNADGSTVLNPVPLPASVLLFGSSLLGLIGIRRKNS